MSEVKKTYPQSTVSKFIGALNDGEIDTVKSMIEAEGSDIVFTKSHREDTALHCACWCQPPSIELVRLILSYTGEDYVHVRCGSERTPLHDAISREKPSKEIIRLLLDIGGADFVRAQDRYGSTVLHFACHNKREKSSFEIVQMLVAVGGKELIMKQNNSGRTALHIECEEQDYPSSDVVKLLSDVGGMDAIKLHNVDGHTSLSDAVWHIHPNMDIIRQLIAVGGKEIVLTESNASLPVYTAMNISRPYFPTIKLLFEVGGCPPRQWEYVAEMMMRHTWPYDHTVILHLAITAGAPENILREMINRIECVNVEDSHGRIPFETAIESGMKWEEGVQMIMKHTGEARIIGKTDPATGLYPFMLAAAGDHYDLSSVYELLRMDTNCCVAQTVAYRKSV